MKNSQPKNPSAFSHSIFKKGENIEMRKHAFTLVELIIVITILAILATIAYTSFSSYTSSARDSVRLSSLKNIESGLIVSLVQTSNLPIPDNAIEIFNSGLGIGSGVLVGNQGYIGVNVSRLINAQKIPKDPNTGGEFVYYRSADAKKYQIMSFLEKGNIASVITQQSFANKNLTPTTLGDNLGIILDTNNVPVTGSGGRFDVFGDTGTFKLFTSQLETISKSGSVLITNTYALTGYSGSSINDLREPKVACNHPDILVYGPNGSALTIAACNMGTTIAGTGVQSYGAYYQYGNNYPFQPNPSQTGAQIINIDGISPSSYFSPIYNTMYPWTNIEQHNLWGSQSNTDVDRKGPCSQGYHVPSTEEYEKLLGGFLNINCINPHYQQLGRVCGIILQESYNTNHIALIQSWGVNNITDAIEKVSGKIGTNLKIPVGMGSINKSGVIANTHNQMYLSSDISLKPILLQIYNSTSGSYGIIKDGTSSLFTDAHQIRCFKN